VRTLYKRSATLEFMDTAAGAVH